MGIWVLNFMATDRNTGMAYSGTLRCFKEKPSVERIKEILLEQSDSENDIGAFDMAYLIVTQRAFKNEKLSFSLTEVELEDNQYEIQ